MQDPIADMLTRVRNGQHAKHEYVTMKSSKIKEEIARVLQQEGFIDSYHSEPLENNTKDLTIKLKYYQEQPVIDRIKRVSKPGLRVYKSCKELAAVPGFGVYILSTSSGVMTHVAAKERQIGGEIICEVA